jgi:hypothetical protein
VISLKRNNNELYRLYNELDVVKVIKIGRMRWLGHLCRRQELDPYRKITLLQPEGTRRVRKPKSMWLDSVQEVIKKMGVRNWRNN